MKTTDYNHRTIFVVAREKLPLPQSNQSLTKLFNFLQPLRQWLDHIEIHNPRIARLIASLIPAQCPFEREFRLFGHKIAYIPPLCKLNPFYEQLVSLRFRALCFLADECGEDIQSYC
ncbi:MAG: Mo-dependent nitrogenase C-terminal domain-containing protein [Coleofasciculaceae cyanobacterium]